VKELGRREPAVKDARARYRAVFFGCFDGEPVVVVRGDLWSLRHFPHFIGAGRQLFAIHEECERHLGVDAILCLRRRRASNGNRRRCENDP
jgi:hypothetical protein